MELIVMLAIGILAAAALVAGFNSNNARLSSLRSRAEQQFLATNVKADSGAGEFDGRVATVLKESESHYLASLNPSNYTLTRVAAMPDGSQFLFKSSHSGKPFLSALSTTPRLSGK